MCDRGGRIVGQSSPPDGPLTVAMSRPLYPPGHGSHGVPDGSVCNCVDPMDKTHPSYLSTVFDRSLRLRCRQQTAAPSA
jgi:hypothetical protein